MYYFRDMVTTATLERMERYGSTFEVTLAYLYKVADQKNRILLEENFARSFKKYNKIQFSMSCLPFKKEGGDRDEA